jgi:hypothetical protein
LVCIGRMWCSTVDVPARFRNSKAVGAVFGLTPSKYQSGEINRTGAISKCGDEMIRVMLYEAAQIMLARTAKWSWLKAWAIGHFCGALHFLNIQICPAEYIKRKAGNRSGRKVQNCTSLSQERNASAISRIISRAAVQPTRGR